MLWVTFKTTRANDYVVLNPAMICSMQPSATEDGLPTRLRTACGDMFYLPYTIERIVDDIKRVEEDNHDGSR